MQSVEELEQELIESEAEFEAKSEAMAGSRVADLTELVTKGGKMRGHLTGLTPKQYRKYIGREAPPDLLVKAKDATTRKVQWDLVLDQLASERGYKSDEELRDAIEQAHDDKMALEKMKSGQRAIRQEIIEKLKAEPEVKTIVLDDACPQFPESTCAAEVTMVNGVEFRLRRQHSYWRLDRNGKPSIRIRYAKDARNLARIATKDYKTDIREARIEESKKRLPGRRIPASERLQRLPRRAGPRITPKRPRLER